MEFRLPVVLASGAYTPSSPLEEAIVLSQGMVTDVAVHFPAGCAGTVGLRVLRGLNQVWPTSPGQWFISDDFTIVFPTRYLLFEKPYAFTVEAYNTGEWSHTVSVTFTVAGLVSPEEAVLALLEERLAPEPEEAVKAVYVLGETGGQIKGLMEGRFLPLLEELRDYVKAQSEATVKRYTLEEMTTL